MNFKLILLLLFLVSCVDANEIIEEDVSVLNTIGVEFANRGDNENAKLQFEKVLTIDLSHEEARNNLALIYLKENNFNKSIEHYTMLTKLYPDKPGYHHDLGISIANNCQHNNICDLEFALNEFEIAEQLEPGHGFAAENIKFLKDMIANS